MYQRASTNGLSKRGPTGTLETLELEREEVVATLLELREVDVDTTLLEVVTATLLELREVEVDTTLLELRELEVTATLLEVAGTLELLGVLLEVDGVELFGPTMP